MSSNDGTRSTDAHKSRLAHRFFPVSLNWLASRGGTFLGGMLSVNQANDHGEIIVSGVAYSAAHDAKVRIEVIVDWNSGFDIGAGRLNSYRRQLGAYQRRGGASRGVAAADDGTDDRRVSWRLAVGRPAFIDSTFVTIRTIERFISVPPLLPRARRRRGRRHRA